MVNNIQEVNDMGKLDEEKEKEIPNYPPIFYESELTGGQ